MRLQVQQTFVKGLNFRSLKIAAEALTLSGGGFGKLSGTPGIGKSVTAQAVAANIGGVYLRVASIWRRSELDFIQELCRELGIDSPPARKGRCYNLAIEKLIGTDRVVFVDEAARLPRDFLNILLDLCDVSACPFVLVGEPELKSMMEENKRLWSRTHRVIEFEPLSLAEVAMYAKQASGLDLPPSVVSILHASSRGDWRILKRDLLGVVGMLNAKGDGHGDQVPITAEIARIAASMGLRGEAAA